MFAAAWAFIQSWGGAAVTAIAPLISPFTDLLKFLWSKFNLFIVAWFAKRAGKKEAYYESVEDVLEDVAQAKVDRNNPDIRRDVRKRVMQSDNETETSNKK